MEARSPEKLVNVRNVKVYGEAWFLFLNTMIKCKHQGCGIAPFRCEVQLNMLCAQQLGCSW